MSALDLTFIGTGNAFVAGGACWSGFLANGRHLFEAPPQTLMSLNRLGIDPNAIETVTISHHHGDHFLGLPMLFLHWKYRGRETPVVIAGPPGTEQIVRQLCVLAYPGLVELPIPVRWVELAAGEQCEAGPLRLEAFAVQHDDKLANCLGFQCTIDGVTLGYTGDTSLCQGVLDLAHDADVVVSECAEDGPRNAIHMNLADDIPALRKAMRPGAPLILTHLSERITAAELPHTTVARDLASYRFARE